MDKQIKYFTQKAKEVDDRTLEFIGSTEDIDRDNEVIKLSGWRLKNYKKNPVVLVNHNSFDLPVAKTTKVWADRDAKALKFRIKFPEADISPQGDTLYKLYKEGFMNATSVGFMPNRDKMVFGDLERGEPQITFKEQELLEISLVSIPANTDAMITQRKSFQDAIEAKVVDELEITDLEMWMKDIGLFDEEEDEAVVEVEEVEEPQEKTMDEIALEILTGIETEEKDSQDINKNDKCKSCGVEILCLCPSCLEKKETQEYFEKFYQDILFERREEDSA